MPQKPPDLDAYGNPIGGRGGPPPDLDANGEPVKAGPDDPSAMQPYEMMARRRLGLPQRAITDTPWNDPPPSPRSPLIETMYNAGHPQSLGDMAMLAIPSGLPTTAIRGALRSVVDTVKTAGPGSIKGLPFRLIGRALQKARAEGPIIQRPSVPIDRYAPNTGGSAPAAEAATPSRIPYGGESAASAVVDLEAAQREVAAGRMSFREFEALRSGQASSAPAMPMAASHTPTPVPVTQPPMAPAVSHAPTARPPMEAHPIDLTRAATKPSIVTPGRIPEGPMPPMRVDTASLPESWKQFAEAAPTATRTATEAAPSASGLKPRVIAYKEHSKNLSPPPGHPGWSESSPWGPKGPQEWHSGATPGSADALAAQGEHVAQAQSASRLKYLLDSKTGALAGTGALTAEGLRRMIMDWLSRQGGEQRQ